MYVSRKEENSNFWPPTPKANTRREKSLPQEVGGGGEVCGKECEQLENSEKREPRQRSKRCASPPTVSYKPVYGISISTERTVTPPAGTRAIFYSRRPFLYRNRTKSQSYGRSILFCDARVVTIMVSGVTAAGSKNRRLPSILQGRLGNQMENI